jgi:hypothetical protein
MGVPLLLVRLLPIFVVRLRLPIVVVPIVVPVVVLVVGTLYDSGEAGGFLYYVMPFVVGEVGSSGAASANNALAASAHQAGKDDFISCLESNP